MDRAGIAAVEKQGSGAQRARGACAPRKLPTLPPRMSSSTCTPTPSSEKVPPEFAKVEILEPLPPIKRANGEITYRDAIKEAVIEEMLRDSRVIFYGEDVAEYGGAFKLSKGLLEMFGRERVFNTPISEAAICGTAVGAAMIGLRPVVELMYMDFLLMAGDQVGNQAAKWHYMSGAQVEVPMVLRVSVGAGKGYGGQHSQTLESTVVHVPGHVRGLSLHRLRCQGPDEIRHSRQQPDDVYRVARALQRERPRAGRGIPGAAGRGGCEARRQRHHAGCLWAGGSAGFESRRPACRRNRA